MCAMLTPSRVTLSHGEDEHGRGRISLRASDQCAHDGGGFWRLGRCWGCGDERSALPGPPARGHAACHDRPRGVRRLYHDPAHRAPERRGGAHDPLAADRILDLAATGWWCRAAVVSRRRAPAAVAHVRDPAPGRGGTLWG